LRVFIGYDPREHRAAEVCEQSLLRHASAPIEVALIDQAELRAFNWYWREPDPLASTEFAFTRFLTPFLAEWRGHALFMDCDFLWRGDVMQMMQYADPSIAVSVVKHDYRPIETQKMDGKTQTQYPRKAWSSLMLFACSHPQLRVLTPELVNSASGLYLHQLQWLKDESIGELPVRFNYLEGWNTREQCADPVGVHMTRGGPWFEHMQDVEYADEWRAYGL